MRLLVLIQIILFIFCCSCQKDLQQDSSLSTNTSWKKQKRSRQLSGKKQPNYHITGPYTHENLSIFLIHGKDKIKGKKFLTLQEAMAQKKIIVYETGNVNQLSVENTSENEAVYIQAGDIVKGGKQDRVLAVDFIVRPKSGKVPISSFCVEQGRWSKRQQESLNYFSASSDQVATKELKKAVKYGDSQSTVWNNVVEAQEMLSENVGSSVESADSSSSMQLTLENKKVRENTNRYIVGLKDITKNKQNVIGYAFTVNGKISSADIYGSNALFQKLWAKLLKSSAIEALSARQKKDFATVGINDIKNWLVNARKGKVEEKNVNAHTRIVTRKSKNILSQKTYLEEDDAAIHENYMSND